MATVQVDRDRIVVRFSRGERLLALRRNDIEIPIANVTSVRKINSTWSSVGFGPPYRSKRGSFTPTFVIGSWRRRRGHSTFAAIRRNAPGYVIETTGEPFDVIALSTPDIEELEARAETVSSEPAE